MTDTDEKYAEDLQKALNECRNLQVTLTKIVQDINQIESGNYDTPNSYEIRYRRAIEELHELQGYLEEPLGIS